MSQLAIYTDRSTHTFQKTTHYDAIYMIIDILIKKLNITEHAVVGKYSQKLIFP